MKRRNQYFINEVDLLAGKISKDSYNIIRSYDNSPFRNYIVAREGLALHYFGELEVGALPIQTLSC